VISYTSTNSTRDGAWRKVEIRSSRSGVAIASRGGYFAPPSDDHAAGRMISDGPCGASCQRRRSTCWAT
jgi:hypothetical protein